MDLIKEIIKFARKHDYWRKINTNKLYKIIQQHFSYQTILVTRDEKGIASMVRWNWKSDIVIEVLDMIIREDLRHTGLLKKVLIYGLQQNPNCKYLLWERERKLHKPKQLIEVEKLIKRYGGK